VQGEQGPHSGCPPMGPGSCREGWSPSTESGLQACYGKAPLRWGFSMPGNTLFRLPLCHPSGLCASGSLSGLRAVAAGAAEQHIVPGDRIAGAALDLVQHPLQLVVGERLDLAAVVADEVVMVLAAWMDRLEA
jgi:hypothetical protein